MKPDEEAKEHPEDLPKEINDESVDEPNPVPDHPEHQHDIIPNQHEEFNDWPEDLNDWNEDVQDDPCHDFKDEVEDPPDDKCNESYDQVSNVAEPWEKNQPNHDEFKVHFQDYIKAFSFISINPEEDCLIVWNSEIPAEVKGFTNPGPDAVVSDPVWECWHDSVFISPENLSNDSFSCCYEMVIVDFVKLHSENFWENIFIGGNVNLKRVAGFEEWVSKVDPEFNPEPEWVVFITFESSQVIEVKNDFFPVLNG